MLLAVTGGGTGGHVYPALEVARLAAERGADLLYVGSNRGQEGAICRQRGIEFVGFDSQPVFSLKTVKGWRAMLKLLQATGMAKKLLRERKPDVVFSTGGYSAAPVVAAARSLKIPYVMHEANSVPGRSNRLFVKQASAFTCSFEATLKFFPGAVRTGQPIRRELREAAGQVLAQDVDELLVFGVGGSQGSAFLNKNLPPAASLLKSRAEVLLSTGRSNYGNVKGESTNLRLVPYLESEALVDVYSRTSVVVARSGGILAEFALFGIPGVLVPLPTSADNHQLMNAREFEEMGCAEIVEESVATPALLATAVDRWLQDPERRARARKRLKEWDRPDATERIVTIVERAAVSAS